MARLLVLKSYSDDAQLPEHVSVDLQVAGVGDNIHETPCRPARHRARRINCRVIRQQKQLISTREARRLPFYGTKKAVSPNHANRGMALASRSSPFYSIGATLTFMK